MTKTSVLITALTASINFGFGQDTIKVELSVYYTSDLEPNRGKDFASRVKYASEDIVFSKNHRRIEYCYYYDNKKHCHGIDYYTTSDSTIKIDEETWRYTIKDNGYYVERYNDVTYISGFVKSLIPFEPTGTFITTTTDKIDTLWTREYSPSNMSPPWKFHKTKVNGRMYSKQTIEEPPTLLNGDMLEAIYLKRNGGCISEPYRYVKELKFVVTSEGRIVNIEQSAGNIDLEYCPYYMMDLICHISAQGKIYPAKVKEQSVNVEWTLKVEMDY